MEVKNRVSVEQVYEDLLAEHKACQQHLHSKEEALKIFQKQLRDSNIHKQRLEQEIKQLHSQLARTQIHSPKSSSYNTSSTNQTVTPTSSLRQVSGGAEPGTYDSEREKYILDLEEAQEKNSELFRQIQLLEDEKEELAGERDYYSGKCGNLMKCLEEERQAKPPSHSALQTVMEENRQLKLELVEVQAERDQALNRIERYKKAVERRKTKENAGDQDLQFAVGGKKQDLRIALRRISELESLANSLSESVKDKTISLSHQKRANKMLASRITELEHRLKVLEISGLWPSPESLVPDIADPLLTPDRIEDVISVSTSDNLQSTGTNSTLIGSFSGMDDNGQMVVTNRTDQDIPVTPLNPFDEELDEVSKTTGNNCESNEQCNQLDREKLNDQSSSNKDGGQVKQSMVNLA